MATDCFQRRGWRALAEMLPQWLLATLAGLAYPDYGLSHGTLVHLGGV